MKTLLLGLVLLFSLGSHAQQNDKKDVEVNAYSFLITYYRFDVSGAIPYSDDETIDFLDIIQGMLDQNPIPDSLLSVFQETEITLHNKDTRIMGDSARVYYTLILPEKAEIPPMEKSLKMVKKGGLWLAHYTMMDAMADNKAAMEKEED